ncbi:MAG: ABC transporter ATP-binding protein [Gemmatimonadaceae bacterium]
MTSVAVDAEGLSKTYRIRHPEAPTWRDFVSTPGRSLKRPRTVEVQALRDVSFQVQEGEVFGIIGRNGAGKSTLLKILSRITAPSGGRATIRGRVASLLEVGTGFHPELTGRENVYLNGMLLGMTSRDVDRAFGEICEFAGVGPYIDTPIKRYSSGMQLRLAFAVAAHLAADTMIIDEVLAVGDAEFQAKCTSAMRDAANRGRTTLFVSHNMAAVEKLCSRGLSLEAGVVKRIGTASEVVREYLKSAHEADGAAGEFVSPANRAQHSSVFFSRVSVRGADGNSPVQGEDIVVEVELTARESIRRLQIALSISTEDGQLVSLLTNGDSRAEWDLCKGTYRATVHLDAPRLIPRVYTLSLRAMLEWGAEILDDVPDALSFVVQERDVLGTGVPLLADRGVTWTQARYSIEHLTESSIYR